LAETVSAVGLQSRGLWPITKCFLCCPFKNATEGDIADRKTTKAIYVFKTPSNLRKKTKINTKIIIIDDLNVQVVDVATDQMRFISDGVWTHKPFTTEIVYCIRLLTKVVLLANVMLFQHL